MHIKSIKTKTQKNKMFYRIFSKTKKTIKKQAKIPKTPKIIVDVHEKNSLIIANLHNSKQVRLEIKSLKIGDYLIGNTIIERKTISDFINSMINKRLMQQFKQMKKYKQQLLVIEGDLEQLNDFKNPNALRGFILSILIFQLFLPKMMKKLQNIL